MQQTVRLLDRLGEEYGEEHVYHDLRSPADAIKMLCINRPKFYEELLIAHKNGIFYRVMQSGADMEYNELHLTLGSKDLYIVPVIGGSLGNNTGRLLIGVGLLAASFLIPGAGAFGVPGLFAGAATAGKFVAALGTAAGAIGTAMVLGSVADMISPQPQLPSLSGKGRMQGTGESVRGTGPGGATRATSGEKSYAYTGATSSAGVGAVVPVAFGKVLAGSHLLSLDISTSVEGVVTTSLSSPGIKTLRVNQEYVDSEFKSLGQLRTRKWDPGDIDYTNNTSEDKDQVTHRNDSGAQLKLLYDSDGKRILPSTSSLTKNALQDDNRRKNFQVFFEMDQGLYDKVGFSGSSRLDGSVSYTISLRAAGMKGSDQIVSKVSASVQGNIDRSDPIRWCHAIAFPKLKKSSDTYKDALIETIVEVTDFNVYKRANEGDSGQMRLKVMFTGYDFFDDSDENRTAELIESES
jgi:predicted phage tail protein